MNRERGIGAFKGVSSAEEKQQKRRECTAHEKRKGAWERAEA